MSAHNSSHGASKKEKARVEAQKARARQAQKPSMAPSMPLFDGPKKVQNNGNDLTSLKIQKVLGSYEEVRPYVRDSNMIGVSRQPSTPQITDSRSREPPAFFPSSQPVNGQHKPTERKIDPNRSLNFPTHSNREMSSASGSNRKSLPPHYPSSSSSQPPSHARSSSASPPSLSHSSPVKQNQSSRDSRPSASPVSSQRSKPSVDMSQKPSKVLHSSHAASASHNSTSPATQPVSSSQNSQPSNATTTSHGIKIGTVLPNGFVSDQSRANRNNLPKLVIPELNKKEDIQVLDEIFNEMTTMPPPLTGIQTPRKAEEKFPFPAQKTSSINCLSDKSSPESLTEEKREKKDLIKDAIVTEKPEEKSKSDLAENKSAAMKECKIQQSKDDGELSSSDSSSCGSSESGSDSDSNNSDDEEEEEEEDEKKDVKDESIKELEKSTDSTSSKEHDPTSQHQEPKWSLFSFIEKPRTSPISQFTPSSTKPCPSSNDKIHDDNDAFLDEMVKSIPGKSSFSSNKKMEMIGPSSTLPFDSPALTDEDDDETIPGCDTKPFQNGATSDDDFQAPSSVKNPPSVRSPSAVSSCSSDTGSTKISKPAQKQKQTKQRRQSSSNKTVSDKHKKDSKSSSEAKKGNSSDTVNLKPPDGKVKEEKKRKTSAKKHKKTLSREFLDSDSDIDVDVVSVTPGKHSAPMSSMLSDHNQNDKYPVSKQLFTSPKQQQSSPESKLNNSQSSVSGKSSKHNRVSDRDREREHEKSLYKKKHKDSVKKTKPQIYKSSDEDESTEVEDMLESTEDFRPPSLHSPLPPYPYPCKEIKTSPSPSDTKPLVSDNSSIKSLKPESVKNVKSPKLECAVKKVGNNVHSSSHHTPVKTPVIVQIDLSLLKKGYRNSVSALKKTVAEERVGKVKKENGHSVSDHHVDVKSSDNSSSKDSALPKKVKRDPLDENVTKKDASSVSKSSSSPAKVPKKESDSSKSSSVRPENTDSNSGHPKKTSTKKDSDNITSKDSFSSEAKKEPDGKKEKEKDFEFKKERDSDKRDKESSSSSGSSIKKESKLDSKESSRSKDSKPHKRKTEEGHNESAKKHKSSSKNSNSSSSSKRSSHENGVDGDGEEEKRPSSRNERRNSTSSTSSHHSSKSHSKKPRLESKPVKDTDKSSSKREGLQQNGDNHLPFSNYSDHSVPISPSKPSKHTSSSKPVPLTDELDPADRYLTRAKELKHQADSQKDNPVQLITYTEAVLAFIQCGYAMERRKLSEPLRIFTMYTETLQLLKSISRLRHAQSTYDKKLSAIIQRIQALLCLKLFRLKQSEVVKFKKIIEQHDQTKSSKPSYAPSPHQGSFNNRSTGIPSPMSPTPSPAGSIGSVGSQGSCELSAGKLSNGTSLNTTSTPMASPGTVNVSQRIYSVQQQYFTISSFLINAHEFWDQAEQDAAENKAFFDNLDKHVGPLVFTDASFKQLVTYVQKGLQCLKDT